MSVKHCNLADAQVEKSGSPPAILGVILPGLPLNLYTGLHQFVFYTADKSAEESNNKFTNLKGGKLASGKRKSEAIVDDDEGAPNKRKRLRRSGKDKQTTEPTEVRRSSRRGAQKKEEEGKGDEKLEEDKSSSSSAVIEKDEATIKAGRFIEYWQG